LYFLTPSTVVYFCVMLLSCCWFIFLVFASCSS
jgi:hypothetical protein